jgi:hypothetical protein
MRELLVVAGLSAALGIAPGCGSPDGDLSATMMRPDETMLVDEPAACPDDSVLTYENFGAPFMLDYCTGCHSARLLEAEARRDAPPEVNLDSLSSIREHLDAIAVRATGDRPTMPPGGGPPASDRTLLAEWIACGAPGGSSSADFMGLDSSGAPMTPPYDPGSLEGKACENALQPLGAAALPRCTAATYECVLECERTEEDSEDCKDACYALDPTAPSATGVACGDCVSRQGLACARASRCASAVSAAVCCLYEDCETTDCAKTTCAPELQAMVYCIAYDAPECFDLRTNEDLIACFAP